jgi:hypothetical protein
MKNVRLIAVLIIGCVQYFPRDRTVLLTNQLRDYCDFKNRNGNFINDFYTKNIGGPDEVSDISSLVTNELTRMLQTPALRGLIVSSP